jgi:hypothetical protein
VDLTSTVRPTELTHELDRVRDLLGNRVVGSSTPLCNGRPDRGNDEDPGEQAAFRNDDPQRLRGTNGRALMLLADYHKEILTHCRRRIPWQRCGSRPPYA